jgi:hypothetical protein
MAGLYAQRIDEVVVSHTAFCQSVLVSPEYRTYTAVALNLVFSAIDERFSSRCKVNELYC